MSPPSDRSRSQAILAGRTRYIPRSHGSGDIVSIIHVGSDGSSIANDDVVTHMDAFEIGNALVDGCKSADS